MSASYLILPEKKLIIGRFAGPTGADDIKRLLHKIWADPLFDRAFHLLMDFTRAVLRIGVAEVAGLCNGIMSIAGGVMGSAAILASGPVGTALAMLFSKGLSLFTPSSVFSTWGAALDFLGVDLPEDPQG
ncbi:MAG: hypothetical protein WC076_00135 [Terrimicrobiaceae bacterium]|nr:hypothetical protein [Terrimicrobiaceae bacterium]